MSTDETARKHTSLLARPLAGVTRGVAKAPVTVLAVGMGLALLCVGLAIFALEFRTSRLDLLNPKSAFNQRWLAYLDEFGDADDIVVVINGESQPAIVAAMDDLAEVLRPLPEFRSIMQKVDLSALRPKGLHYLSVDELRQIEEFLAAFQPVLDGDWNRLSLANAIAPAAETSTQRPTSSDLQTQLSAVLSGDAVEIREPRFATGLAQLDARLASRYLLLDDGRTGVVLLRLADTDAAMPLERAIPELSEQIEVVGSRHPQVTLGLTGMPVLEFDEMRSSKRDTMRASVLSLVGVSCVFIAGFGGLRRPLLAVAALLIGIAWSMGYMTLVVGHLNILSVAFGVILIGLGIDFGIHYLARYLQDREQMLGTDDALIETAHSVGPGIVTGGLTSALAFFMAGLTDFTGIAELGIVAGGGIVLCVIAALTMLPAMLHLTDRQFAVTQQPTALPFGKLCRWTTRYPRLVLATLVLVTIALGTGLTRLRYDHNLLNLQPKNQQSVDLERQLAATPERSVWYAVSMCKSRAELLDRKAKFDTMASVVATEEIASLVPATSADQLAAIVRIADQLSRLPEQPPLIPVVDQETFVQGLMQAGPGGSPSMTPELGQMVDELRRLPPSEYFARISRWQQTTAGQLLDAFRRLGSMASPAPPQIGDLPEPLAARYIGRTGQHLLKVYGHSDIWNMESLRQFVGDVESVDPQITGHPIQTFYASSQMQQSYIHAAIYSLLAVAIVLMLDFRTIKHSLLAMLPMGLGLVQLLGLLGWLDIPLNPANMIVLPLILGIGIDDGVHVVHDALRQGAPDQSAPDQSASYQRASYQISNATASAVFLTSATTMIGFGSMMIASHQGLRSLGQVLTLGVFCCLVSSVLVLPVLLGNRRLSSD
ncbi:MAG: MMPL family transporter [Planctomycetota bacterium]|nr:MMPL family transporter [Planctomycetota bacterium]